MLLMCSFSLMEINTAELPDEILTFARLCKD